MTSEAMAAPGGGVTEAATFEFSQPHARRVDPWAEAFSEIRDCMAGYEEQDEAGREAMLACKRELFEPVVRETFDEIYTVAMRLTGNVDDAQDVTQEAYLRAFQAAHKFQGNAAFSTWMYHITANAAAKHMKKGGRHRHVDLDDIKSDDHPADHTSGDKIASIEERTGSPHFAKLQHALSTLSDNLRQVIVPKDIYDMPHADIGEELGISETAAKVRLHRARKKMKELLGADFARLVVIEDADANNQATLIEEAAS